MTYDTDESHQELPPFSKAKPFKVYADRKGWLCYYDKQGNLHYS